MKPFKKSEILSIFFSFHSSKELFIFQVCFSPLFHDEKSKSYLSANVKHDTNQTIIRTYVWRIVLLQRFEAFFFKYCKRLLISDGKKVNGIFDIWVSPSVLTLLLRTRLFAWLLASRGWHCDQGVARLICRMNNSSDDALATPTLWLHVALLKFFTFLLIASYQRYWVAPIIEFSQRSSRSNHPPGFHFLYVIR